MNIVKIIGEDNTFIALILPQKYNENGLNFLTDSNHSLQLAYINNPVGHEISRHYHPKYTRVITETMECLVVKKGNVEVTFYDNYQNFISTYNIKSGDLVLFLNGGHSIKNIEKSELIEIRQGPYNQSMDKVKF